MSEDTEKILYRLNSDCDCGVLNDGTSCIVNVTDVKKIIDLYQKEKERNKDLWKAYLDVSNDRENNYIEKDKVKELFYKKRGLIEREDLQELLGGK